MAAGFAALRVGYERRAFAHIGDGLLRSRAAGFGPLVRDPGGLLDLPEGFTYTILSRAGERMSDGLIVPGKQDGMAAFPGPDGLTLLVCNHELDASMGPDAFQGGRLAGKVAADRFYDRGHGKPTPGGTSTLVFDTKAQRLERQFLSLAGTERNCSGGPTPRNSWITCEETVTRPDRDRERDHGWCFEVPATSEAALADPKPIRGMGRFNHEACATDPRTGVVYLTEDRGDGLIYRYVPRNPRDLHDGGRLQALAVEGRRSLDTRNWEGVTVRKGQRMPVKWIDLDETDSPKDDLRYRGFALGAARFARGEGMWWGHGCAYFACTNGGARQVGQLWKLRPGVEGETDTLELFVESTDPAVLEYADNICVAPWGDLIVCEDGEGVDHLVGVTPAGELYRVGRNAMNDSEFAGSTFSPDGTTLFVNIQTPGLTLAVVGPWPRA